MCTSIFSLHIASCWSRLFSAVVAELGGRPRGVVRVVGCGVVRVIRGVGEGELRSVRVAAELGEGS